MDGLAHDFADRAHFLFVYVREAHPDEDPDHPAHRSIEQKFRHARDMQDRHNSPRTILVDSVDGNVHRLYGGLPNMSWVIDHTGRVVHKAAWTVAADVRSAIEDASRIRELKREASASGALYKDYYRETISALPTNRSVEPKPALTPGDGPAG